MNIYCFKHIKKSKNKTDDSNYRWCSNKKEKAFTFIEVLLVISLIGFLYVVSMKVIQHNVEQKTALYVYYLYKNLENESQILTKKVLEDPNVILEDKDFILTETKRDNAMQKVLQNIDAKKYCELFANDINVTGKVNCEENIKNEEISVSKNITTSYDCKRDYSFTIDNDGKYNEVFNPTYNLSISQCLNNKNFESETVKCNATPTKTITNLIKNNLFNQTYTCTKTEETTDDESAEQSIAFDINVKPQMQKSLKSANNINFNFVTLSNSNIKKTGIYNLFADVTQEAICPSVSIDKNANDFIFLTQDPIKYITDKGFDNKNLDVTWYPNKNNGSFLVIAGAYQYYKGLFGSTRITPSNINVRKDEKNYKNVTTCEGRLANLRIQKRLCETFKNGQIISFRRFDNNKIDYSSTKKWEFKDYFSGQSQIYYTKWNSFFQNNPSFEIKEIEEFSLTSVDEGKVTSSIPFSSYIAHFIYTTIDKSFKNGNLGKDIFIFEHFGDKIIPVGYLANNLETPLKFNVITRDLKTLKLKKLNDKPLTFCEAMIYTGDKFSPYCECPHPTIKGKALELREGYYSWYDATNWSGELKAKRQSCENKFGCNIYPIKPSSGTPNIINKSLH